MDKNFWLERWQNKQIGFHQLQVNPLLIRHWPDIGKSGLKRVFVPLCGKSADLLWLMYQGYEVVAIELSQLAVEEFFSEQELDYTIITEGPLRRYQGKNITIFQGDFFELTAAALGSLSAVFDRAALIALPEQMRDAYCRHLSMLGADAEMLLISMEYDQQLMQGPPFAVAENELQRHFSSSHQLQLLETADVLELSPKFRQQGLQSLVEKVYKLSPLRNAGKND
ncbi:MAG: thiopurine S-methyltransferase [Gammaproteobacteria bacterium]|nr:thiopurine S-methyltransferase [Gammaproteobacteria bacterium]